MRGLGALGLGERARTNHRHEEGELLARSKKVAIPSAPPPEEPAAVEDAGSQALSEALSSSFAVVKLVMVGLIAVFLGSGIFTVPSQERAIGAMALL